MSKLWKGIKKVFKKVVKFVKKYWKVIVIAAAIYFTAGIALAAMPSTAAFSAAMPGFGVGGMFSNAAVAMGATGAAGSGIAGTVAANAAIAAGSSAAVAAGGAAAGGSGLGLSAGGAGSAAGGSVMSAASQAAAVGANVGVGGVAATTTAVKAGAGLIGAVKGMTALEKVAVAGTVFKTVGSLLSDSDDDVNRKSHNRRFAQSFGIDRKGEGPGWGGAMKDAFAGKFGTPEGVGAGGEEGGATPFTPVSSAQGGDSDPFSDMAYSEQAAQRDQSVVGSGYRNRNYMPQG